jgi:hypothetical protein
LTSASPRRCNACKAWLEGTAIATKYRCYLIRDEHIAAQEILDCDDDAAAVTAADRILSATTTYTRAEVWERARMVSFISRKSSAA